MKAISTLLIFPMLVTACSYEPIAPQLTGKTPTEQKAFLLDECEDEAWRGHDSGSHYHNMHKLENRAHETNMKQICKALTMPNADKKNLVAQCKIQAQNKAAFSNKRLVIEHANRLVEICDGFASVKD